MAKVLLFHFLFLFTILFDVVETNCNNDNKIINKTQDCPFSSSTGDSGGQGVGFAFSGFVLVLSLFSFICCCCCKGDREKSTDADVQTTRDDMNVISSNTASGGYVNTAACPPGILTPCPEYSHPATQEGFLGNYRRNIYLPQEAVLSTENDDPPPPYTEYEPPNLNANVPPIIRHNEDPAQNTSHNRPWHQYVMGMQLVPPIIRHLEDPAHNTSHNGINTS
uniref:Uncharacterized protein LOC111108299 n=1 Tax=Crassostrea virginica TaxID=6565 RepID=A0A8B8B9F4_CRAVI|nr:uncharacterized protein LOC111108299 [Crassostrea virginica]